MSTDPLLLVDVYRARRRIRGLVLETPLAASSALSREGAEVRLKLEHLQTTGAFKLRGATNAILGLTGEQRRRGVIGVSTGNFGRGLAYAARRTGTRCVICMSHLVPQNKIEGIRALGAEVRLVGRSQDEAQGEVDRIVDEDGMVNLDPFDHPEVIAGQGTLGLEIMEQWPQVDQVVVPLSGGGLIAGVALAAKSVNPGVRVVGVTMERGAAMYESIKAGKPVQVEEYPSLADSLGGGIGLNNRYTFEMVRRLVDDCILVSEREIAEGIRHAYWREKQVVEGAGAVGLSAILADKIGVSPATCVVMSGGNIDMDLHHRIAGGENPDLGGQQ